MPIRHCQICGIKVIVDADKTAVYPFFCDLCRSRTQSRMAAVSAPGKDVGKTSTALPPIHLPLPTGHPAPVPPPPPPPPTPPPPEKFSGECPECGAEIRGIRQPQPQKVTCTFCLTELAIMPDGPLRPWKEIQATASAPQDKSPTVDLREKIRQLMHTQQSGAEPSSPATQSPPPEPQIVAASPLTHPILAKPSAQEAPTKPLPSAKAPAPQSREAGSKRATSVRPRPPSNEPTSIPTVQEDAPTTTMPPTSRGNARSTIHRLRSRPSLRERSRTLASPQQPAADSSYALRLAAAIVLLAIPYLMALLIAGNEGICKRVGEVWNRAARAVLKSP